MYPLVTQRKSDGLLNRMPQVRILLRGLDNDDVSQRGCSLRVSGVGGVAQKSTIAEDPVRASKGCEGSFRRNGVNPP